VNFQGPAMRPLSVEEMIGVWEKGDLRSPVDRALLMLQAATPGSSLQELAELNVGERDRRLLELREKTIGTRLSCAVECPACGEDLQFEFDTREIVSPALLRTTERLMTAVEEFSVTFRLPDSQDLTEALRGPSAEDVRMRLLARCLPDVRKSGVPFPVEELPKSVIAEVCKQMAQSDPQTDVQFSVECQSCGKGWQAPFDVARFFWAEMAVRAQRALSEVHVLASAYGWSESDILCMSAARREFYLQMVGE
jgi:hypothetical protein